jgi:DNA-binding GntR family transcriptional regulator
MDLPVKPSSKRRSARARAAKAMGRAPSYGRLQAQLREEILDGTIPSGSRLKVSDITARYNTSTNPAREALQGLEGEGLVTITPNRGARVRLIDEDMVGNIFDIRNLLEPYFIRSFVELASPEDVAELRRLQERCELAAEAGNYAEFHVANNALHDHIREWHPNTEAIRIIKQHTSWLRSLSRKSPLSPALMKQSNKEHWELLERVEAGDPDGAVEVMERHMHRARTVFLANLRRARLRRVAEASEAPASP